MRILVLAALVTLGGLPALRAEMPFVPPGRSLSSVAGAVLSESSSGDPEDIARAFLRANREALGLTPRDIEDARLLSRYQSAHTGVSHLYFQQWVGTWPVFGTQCGVHVAANGAVLAVHANFVTDAAQQTEGVRAIEPEQTVTLAAQLLQLQTTQIPRVRIQGPGEAQIDRVDFVRDLLKADLAYVPVAPGKIRLSWIIDFRQSGAPHLWTLAFDAENGRNYLKRDGFIVDTFHGESEPARESALAPRPKPAQNKGLIDQYEVYALPLENPNDGARTIEVDPADPIASPFGWHDTNGVAGAEFTITRGNNIHAFLDRNNDDLPDPGTDVDGGANLDFTGPLVAVDLALGPNTYSNAAQVNLFYYVNLLHDVTYQYGFDEPAGNFQVNNYDRGGVGGDDVIAYAQKGADRGSFNNAFFGTPADGSRPEMLMLEWNATNPRRDGDFSNGVMAHEFGHGVSNRLVGGPAAALCLENNEQMGEGWSDFLALFTTAVPSDQDVTPRGIGTYVLGQAPDGSGIRSRPYSTDMSVNEFTYADLPGQFGSHGVGFVWCSILWEVYWALTNEHGFNGDFYAPWHTGGNNLALQLVLDGMKLAPCSPGFVDARDAILLADQQLTGGANQCLMWEAFAKRGLGEGADQGSSASSTDGTASFEVPLSCTILPCPSDLNGDRVINQEDAALLLGAWGTATPDFDINDDGRLDILDVLQLPSLFGDCP